MYKEHSLPAAAQRLAEPMSRLVDTKVKAIAAKRMKE